MEHDGTESRDTLPVSSWEGAFFGAGWQPGGSVLDSTDVVHGHRLTTVGVPEERQIAEVAALADRTRRQWWSLPPENRAEVLRRAAELLITWREELAGWLVAESGAVWGKALWELEGSAAELNEAAELATLDTTVEADSPVPGRRAEARRVPLGVVGVITPWNMPMLLAVRSVGPALATGNAVLLKPDPNTPVSGGTLLAHVLRRAGVPDGLFAVLPGDADTARSVVDAAEVTAVSFTGSTSAGREVGRRAGGGLKKCLLELGGNNPFVVLDDADPVTAAEAGAWGGFVHSGQLCIGVGRHLVHRSIAEEYVAALVERAEALVVGDPRHGGTQIGPIINRTQHERISSIVAATVESGARKLTSREPEFPFHPPTVLTGVRPGTPAFDEEIFGPVAAVTVFDDDAEAVGLANASEHGLSAAVRSGSEERGNAVARELRAGMIHLGDQTVNSEPKLPFGGFGQSGNGGSFGGVAGVEAFSTWQTRTVTGPGRKFRF
ncbi:aldehyde dehydrogenase family protein [Actinopolyspora mortivallis]|uniref:aldehyde dehydrogenase family protein n=1 Tax=Actinopolyspora mortivallis TaxID=33906 RepID=UPI0003715FB7|nr:aldehyde dehydrogenase family protein [Actinopolyspora mortivallis]